MREIPHIPLAECKRGHVYRIRSRNLVVGVYDGNEGFIGVRHKFGSDYLFTEYHWDQGPPYGTTHPIEEIGVLPEGILPVDDLGSACRKTGRPVVWRTEPQFHRGTKYGDKTTGSWCYEGTDEIIPEYPESSAVSVANGALFDFLKPLSDAEYARRAEERGNDLVTCGGCGKHVASKTTAWVGGEPPAFAGGKRLCPECRG